MATAEPGPSPPSQAPRKPACAVTFGRSTLLGRHLAAALAASGRWSAVAVLDPSPLPAAPPAAPLAHLSVDLSDPAAPLARALDGVAAVFHVDPTSSAAAASDGSFLSLHRLAAEGTRRLLAACRASGVSRVVYTGSADVVAAGALDVIDADEGSLTYPDKFGNAASELRAQVEVMVLSADGNGGMRTCVLRPSNLFGPGDSRLLRFVAGYARSDFNYRIGLSNEKVKKLCHVGDLETLYENDQLNLQMVAGLTFPYYSEARITFPPTYKYDLNSDQYDTSEKARIPAWCDRVLRKGDNIRQIHYNDAPLRFSDHRPVYATFQVLVQRVDEKKKESLKGALYRQRREFVGDTRAAGHLGEDETDDEDLLGYDSIEPGLPPASSDRRKWWLDNGLPAKARVQPPSNDLLPNPNRPSNPFTPSPEPDWVDIKQLQNSRSRPEPPPARGSQRARTVDFNNPTSSTNSGATQKPAARKMIAPLYPGHAQQILGSEDSRDGLNDLRRSGSGASTHSLPTLPYRASNTLPQNQPPGSSKPQVLRKPAPPPIPNKKPALLTKSSSTRTSPTPPLQRYRDDPPMQESRAYPPPPARRSMAPPPNLARKPIQNLIDDDDRKPALPPRTNANGGGRSGMGERSLMDDESEDMQNMRDWEVLRPVR